MSKDAFEHILGRHCAPTFSGIKAASLISLPRAAYGKCEVWLKQYALFLQQRGIKFILLATMSQRVLVLIYHEKQLANALNQLAARHLLGQYGYPEAATLAELLKHLQQRCQLAKEFPHEIGLFLDYPPADVQGYITHQGQDFCYAGYWKIYHNEATTRALFDQITACTESFCYQLDHGVPMEKLLAAV